MFQLYVTVLARMDCRQRDEVRKKINEKEGITEIVENTVLCNVGSKFPAAGKHCSYVFLCARDIAHGVGDTEHGACAIVTVKQLQVWKNDAQKAKQHEEGGQ